MITICDRDRIIVLNIMYDVISFATPLDGFRERGFVGVTHGPIGFWCSQKLLRHMSFLLSDTVKLAEYSDFLEHRRGWH